MSLEDVVERSRAAEIIDADVEQLEVFADERVLRTSVLPPAITGFGNATLPAKMEALFHSMKLDAGSSPLQLGSCAAFVISCLSDFGTDAKIPSGAPLNLAKLLPSVRSGSQVRCSSPPIQLLPDRHAGALELQ